MPDLRETVQTTLGETVTLEHELGGGGMSRVFVAEDKTLGRKIVVKVLAAETAAGVSIERFKREIEVAARYLKKRYLRVYGRFKPNTIEMRSWHRIAQMNDQKRRTR